MPPLGGQNMAKLAEILSVEQNRTDRDSWMKVHLFRDGRFLRASEISAWHCVRLCGNDIAVSHRKSPQSADGTYVTIGFPPESLDKFTPRGALEEYRDDNHVVLSLSETTFPMSVTAELLADDFAHWKKEQPMNAPPADKRDFGSSQQPSSNSIKELMTDMLSAREDLASVSVTITMTRK